MTDQFLLHKHEPRRHECIARVVAHMESLPEGRTFAVTVEEKKRTRSLQQNAYLWGPCYDAILKHLPGWDKYDVHRFLLGEWSGWERIVGMGAVRMRPIRRSSNLSVSEFMAFVDFIQRYMAEKGIDVPSPSEDLCGEWNAS